MLLGLSPFRTALCSFGILAMAGAAVPALSDDVLLDYAKVSSSAPQGFALEEKTQELALGFANNKVLFRIGTTDIGQFNHKDTPGSYTVSDGPFVEYVGFRANAKTRFEYGLGVIKATTESFHADQPQTKKSESATYAVLRASFPVIKRLTVYTSVRYIQDVNNEDIKSALFGLRFRFTSI